MQDLNLEVVEMVNPFSKPIPGQSLTNAPEGNYPWEKPPQFVTVADAIEDIYVDLMDKEKLVALVQIMAEGAYDIVTLAQIILEKGWRDGKWNTELMMLLAEPTMIILMAIAEKAGIGDYEIFEGENQELDEEEADQFVKDVARDVKQDVMFKNIKIPPAKKESVPSEILEEIETAEIPQPSLLERP